MCIPLAVVFDLDGTLLDTLPDIATSCNHALQQFGLPTLPEEQIRGYVGDGAITLISRATRLSDDDPLLHKVFAAYMQHYVEHPIEKTRWMPHATETIAMLAPLPLAICTNKPRTIVDRILRTLGAADRFVVVVGEGDVARSKPAPDALLLVAEKLAVAPQQLVMVGDGPQDVLCGKSVGARTIAVTGGFASTDVLRTLEPDVLLDSLAEVPDVVRRWRSS